MAVAQASEIAAVPGTVVVGPLPGDLNSRIVFAVGIGSTCQNPAAAKALIDLMTSPAAATVMKSKGMDDGASCSANNSSMVDCSLVIVVFASSWDISRWFE